MFDGVATLGVAMQTDEDGVRHVGPQCRVLHADVARIARETLAGGVGCGTVVAVAAEDTVVEDVAAGEHVQSVAPSRVGDASHVVEHDPVAFAHGTGVEYHTVDEHVPRSVYVATLMAVSRAGDATAHDAHVLRVLDGESPCEIAAASQVDGGVRRHVDGVLGV